MTRIVKGSERYADVIREARASGCIIQIDPETRRTVIRLRTPMMVRINQFTYQWRPYEN